MPRIALIQIVCSEDPADNVNRALSKIKEAARRGARIICLPELFKTRYFPQTKNERNFRLAERIPSQTTNIFCRLARSLKIVIILPLFEKTAEGIYYNSAVIIDVSGRILGKYRKTHIPHDPLFYEKRYFKRGNLGIPVFRTRYARIGVLICYDQWFPEPARILAMKGAEIIFYPTAIGWKPTEPRNAKDYQSAWETIQRGHAIANGVFVAAANRVGMEGKLKFWGGSFVAEPFGKIIVRAADREKIVLADCNLGLIGKTRKEWPFLGYIGVRKTEDGGQKTENIKDNVKTQSRKS